MATATPIDPSIAQTIHDVTWDEYSRLRDDPENLRVRMAYLDGVLTIMSPEAIHEEDGEALSLLIRGVAAGLGLPVKGLRTTTLRRGTAPLKGSGKEPDTAFYLGEHVRAMRTFRVTKRKLDLAVDRPPDLAVEMADTRDEGPALPIYARLGVPEVWVHHAPSDTIRFFRLGEGGYEEVARSVVLPKLTPRLVIQALERLDEGDLDEAEWYEWLKDWARALPDAP